MSFLRNKEWIDLTVEASLFVEELGPKPNNITLTLDIVNSSNFVVFIKSIGFARYSKYSLASLFGRNSFYEVPSIFFHRSSRSKQKGPVIFPIKLDATESMTLLLKGEDQIEQLKDYRYLYVLTSRGYITTTECPIKELKLSAA